MSPAFDNLKLKIIRYKEGDSEPHPVALKPWHSKCHIWVTAKLSRGDPIGLAFYLNCPRKMRPLCRYTSLRGVGGCRRDISTASPT